MDTQGKAAYQEQSCPICPTFESGLCSTCGKIIPQYATVSGSSQPAVINDGFKRPDADHYHIKVIDGNAAYAAISPQQCRECYFGVYTKLYPDRKMTIDELPREISYN